MSSGVTPWRRPPSAIAALLETDVRTPILRASLATFLVLTFMPDLGVDGVVGERRRVRERRHAPVGVLVVVDRELLAALEDVGLLLRFPRRLRADALAQRLGEHERLERGAGLALALGGEVERGRRRSCRRRPSRGPRRCRCGSRRAMRAGRSGPGSQSSIAFSAARCSARVDRRLDLQAALERALGALLAAAEPVDDLRLDPGGEVRELRVLLREVQVVARREVGSAFSLS